MRKALTAIIFLLFLAMLVHFKYFSYSYNHFEYIADLSYHHMLMVIVSFIPALIVGLSFGILSTRKRFRYLKQLFLSISGLGQAIPSLAIIAFGIVIIGIGVKTGILALFIYSISPILENTIVGINSVGDAIVDAAIGMGMSSTQVLLKIELPLASRSIMSGIKTALILNIGTATLAYLAGGGGLGELIFGGLALVRIDMILSGSIPLIIMALISMELVDIIDKKQTPRYLKNQDLTKHG